jgi:AcrR family transcriptional regulator
VTASTLSADTRQRILDAAWSAVRDRRSSKVSMKEIAEAAGVTRQLVYFHYGNRAGLLLAMARHRDEASGFRRRALATRDLAPDAALEALLGAWLDYLPELLPVARALEAAHVAGDEGGAAWQDRMEELHEALRFAVERISGAGGLASPWTVDAATDWIWARVQPSTWAHLVTERGWSAEDFKQRTIGSLLGELLRR